MPPPFRQVSFDEFEQLLRSFPFRRMINSVHMHHTWRPNHTQWRGHQTVLSMWRTHTTQNGWSDIAQHLTIGPDGGLWMGRNWNHAPASAKGHNGSGAAGPFMFEMVGDFDCGKDPFVGAQKEAALRVVARVQDRFALPTETLRFHNQMSGKTCPGDTLNYAATLAEVATLRRPMAETTEAMPILEGDANGLVLEMLREDALLLGVEDAAAELPEREGGSRADLRSPAVGAAEASAADAGLNTEMLERLGPHVINLSRGRFSSSGTMQTDAQDVDAIFGEDLERAMAGRSAADPLRIVLWAHGGLIDEKSGLLIAQKHCDWWQRNGVYPLYFVWETGLLPALGRLLTGRSGGPELAMGERLTEFTDRRVEDLTRVVQGPAIWADMKQSARLAIDPDEGGAHYVARKLAEFCKRHGDAVELHAVGHSAGSIFHASFLPAALDAGVPRIRTLALLAPAIRVDRFMERLAPLVGQRIEALAVFTMNRLRERDDTCLGVYRKSLLYLIHYALEEKRETPVLGLEISMRSDEALRKLFGLGVAESGAAEVVWSKTLACTPPRARSASLSHGGFDDDPLTMDSVLRRILDRDAIILSYADAAKPPLVGAEQAIAQRSIIGGNESSGETLGNADEEEFGVPFDVLDAFERAGAAGASSEEAKPESAEAAPSIGFGPNAKASDVTEFSRGVLLDIMRAANVTSVKVSSTSRSPADQARVMFANLEQFGVAHQRALYGPSGDRVIDVYARSKSAGSGVAAIRAAMTAEILRIGPTRVSRHAADPRVLNVFDVAPNSVARTQAFELAVRSEPRVAKFLTPPADPGYHLEIPQPGGGSA